MTDGGIVGSTTLNNGFWNHIAVVTPENSSLANSILYVNGVAETLTTTGTQTINTVRSANVLIGVRGDSTTFTRDFDGLIDEVAIFDEALFPFGHRRFGRRRSRARAFDRVIQLAEHCFGRLAILRRQR